MAAAATWSYSQFCRHTFGDCIERTCAFSDQVQQCSFGLFRAGRGRSGSSNSTAPSALKITQRCSLSAQKRLSTRLYYSLIKHELFSSLEIGAVFSGGAKSEGGGARNGAGFKAGCSGNPFLGSYATCDDGGGFETRFKGKLFGYDGARGNHGRSGNAHGVETSCTRDFYEGAQSNTGEVEGSVTGVDRGMPEEGNLSLLRTVSMNVVKSDEWKQQQAQQVVSELLQREGVQKQHADKIALSAPLFCSSLVQKVSGMDAHPDSWEEMGLLKRPVNADSESEESTLEDELTAAFLDAYRKPGELPLPLEKKITERREAYRREKSPPKQKLDFKQRKALKRKRKRRRDEDNELEELLGIGAPRGESYRLAQWEANNSAAFKESVDEVRKAEGAARHEEEGVMRKDGQLHDKVETVKAEEALKAGGVNEGGGGSLMDLQGAGLEGKDELGIEQALKEGRAIHEEVLTRREANEEESRVIIEEASEDCEGEASEKSSESRPSEEGEITSESSDEAGGASSSDSLDDQVGNPEKQYRWKLQWCADDARSGGLLAPFFESLGLSPTEVKRLVRVFRRPQVRKRSGKLPIADMITRVDFFASLLRAADGLDAAKRLLDRSKDEALGKMKQDDDVERNVRYLEAALSAQQEQILKAAAQVGDAGYAPADSQTRIEGSTLLKMTRPLDLGNEYREAASSTQRSGQSLNEIPEGIESTNEEVTAVPLSVVEQLGSVDNSVDIPPTTSLEAQQTEIANPSNPALFKEERDQPSSTPPVANGASSQPLTTIEPNPEPLGQQLTTKVTKFSAQPPSWSAGLIVACFPELLFPQIKTRNFEAMAAYLEREVGMTSAEAANVLLLFPPAVALDVETELKPRMRDLKSILRISWPDMARMIKRWPFVLSEMASASAIPTVDFLYREALVGIDAVGTVVAGLPHILFADVDKLLRPSLQFLLNHGVQHKRAHIGLVVSKCPQALLKGPARLSAVLEFLECEANVYMSRTERVLLTCPELLGTRLEVAREKLDFLYDLGLTEGQVGRVVSWKPRVLLTSIQGLEDRVSFFEGLGLSRTEVARMVQQFPDLLTYSVDRNFRPKVDYLVKDMGRSINDLVDFPRFFSYSLDTRIRPRHESARAAGTFQRQASISSLLTPNDVHFREAFLEGRPNTPLDNSLFGKGLSEAK